MHPTTCHLALKLAMVGELILLTIPTPLHAQSKEQVGALFSIKVPAYKSLYASKDTEGKLAGQVANSARGEFPFLDWTADIDGRQLRHVLVAFLDGGFGQPVYLHFGIGNTDTVFYTGSEPVVSCFNVERAPLNKVEEKVLTDIESLFKAGTDFHSTLQKRFVQTVEIAHEAVLLKDNRIGVDVKETDLCIAAGSRMQIKLTCSRESSCMGGEFEIKTLTETFKIDKDAKGRSWKDKVQGIIECADLTGEGCQKQARSKEIQRVFDHHATDNSAGTSVVIIDYKKKDRCDTSNGKVTRTD